MGIDVAPVNSIELSFDQGLNSIGQLALWKREPQHIRLRPDDEYLCQRSPRITQDPGYSRRTSGTEDMAAKRELWAFG